jgi:hypothetical protein
MLKNVSHLIYDTLKAQQQYAFNTLCDKAALPEQKTMKFKKEQHYYVL